MNDFHQFQQLQFLFEFIYNKDTRRLIQVNVRKFLPFFPPYNVNFTSNLPQSAIVLDKDNGSIRLNNGLSAVFTLDKSNASHHFGSHAFSEKILNLKDMAFFHSSHSV